MLENFGFFTLKENSHEPITVNGYEDSLDNERVAYESHLASRIFHRSGAVPNQQAVNED